MSDILGLPINVTPVNTDWIETQKDAGGAGSSGRNQLSDYLDLYLPLAGGEITGVVTVTDAASLDFKNAGGTAVGRIEMNGDQFGFTDTSGFIGFAINTATNAMAVNNLLGDVVFTTNAGNVRVEPVGGGLFHVKTTLDMFTNPINNVVDPTNPQDAATKSYVDAEIKGVRRRQLTAATGNTFALGETGYINASEEVVKTNAALLSECEGRAVMAAEAVAGGTSGSFALEGLITGLSGGTAGKAFFGTTIGGVQNSPPTGSGHVVRVAGYWISDSEFDFLPSDEVIVLK